CDRVGDGYKDVAPYAGVASSDRRNPIPANGGVVRRIVGAKAAAIFARGLKGFLLCAAGCRVFLDANCERVGFAGNQRAADIAASAHKTAFDAPELFAVEINLRFPVDAVEVKPRELLWRNCRRSELGAIPEV